MNVFERFVVKKFVADSLNKLDRLAVEIKLESEKDENWCQAAEKIRQLQEELDRIRQRADAVLK